MDGFNQTCIKVQLLFISIYSLLLIIHLHVANIPSGDNLGGQEMQVTIALSQRNTDLLEDRFWAVSSPTNPQYGTNR